MAKFYFFKSDPLCSWLAGEMTNSYPVYLHEPIDFQGKKTKFYLIFNWLSGGGRGVTTKGLIENKINYVNTINDLPEGGGIFTTGYDANIAELEEAYKKGIPIIERPCVSIRELRRQLISTNKNTHQIIFMIDEGHIIYECYKSAFPDDIIIIQENNFEEIIRKKKNNKATHLIAYAPFRIKDVKKVVDFINQNYPHPDNNLEGYLTTRCLWSKQGLLEEIDDKIKTENLNEIWIVTNSERDRSSQSVINEVKENGAKPIIIKSEADIPLSINENMNIGVLRTPVPQSKEIIRLVDKIKERYKDYYLL